MAGMNEPELTSAEEKLSGARLAVAALAVGAALFALVALVWAVVRFWEISQAPRPQIGEFMQAVALLLGSWGVCLLMWGAAEIIRKLNDLEFAMTEGARAARGGVREALPAGSDEAAAHENQARLLQQLVQLTREVRDIELLTPEDRLARLHAEAQQLARQLEAEVPALLREHNWQEARRRVLDARLRFPGWPAWEQLERQVDEARAGVEAHDFDAATRELDDLIMLGAWERAAEAVRDLQQRYAGSPRVAEFARRVAIGRERTLAEDRARLMAQAQEATNQHNWVEALRRVELVIERYPESAEAADLRTQVPTLRANVEIQIRQRMELEIRDLIKDHRYPEAIARARKLMERYPSSPQAAALREQLPRLELKAAEMSA